MSAGGIIADTMANLKYTVVNPEAVMKSPKVQARIAAAKKAAADKQKEKQRDEAEIVKVANEIYKIAKRGSRKWEDLFPEKLFPLIDKYRKYSIPASDKIYRIILRKAEDLMDKNDKKNREDSGPAGSTPGIFGSEY